LIHDFDGSIQVDVDPDKRPDSRSYPARIDSLRECSYVPPPSSVRTTEKIGLAADDGDLGQN